MKFVKMQGAGNDFILLNNMEEKLPPERLPEIARRLCARRLSIGGDALMVVDAACEGGDYRMRFYNADGTLGEMCGNGARCLARYGYENGLAGEEQRIETDAGLVVGRRISERAYRVQMNDPLDLRLSLPLAAGGQTLDCAYMVLGVPHAVIPFPELDTAEEGALRELGREIRWHSAFPKGANVDFVKPLTDGSFLARTFERGVEDFTLACGTGACSVAVAMTLRGCADGRAVRIHMPGGELTVDLAAEDGEVREVYLTGPTNIVAAGEVLDEDLAL